MKKLILSLSAVIGLATAGEFSLETLFNGAFLPAEESQAFDNETVAGYALENAYFEFEQIYAFEELSERGNFEWTLLGGMPLGESAEVSFRQHMTYEEDFMHSSGVALGLAFAKENYEVANEFEVVYDYDSEEFGGVEILGARCELGSENSLIYGLEMETEWGLPLSDLGAAEGGLFLGPYAEYEWAYVGVHYLTVLRPTVLHGFKISI